MVPAQFAQVAWVVADLEAAMHRWIDTAGVGPFYVNSDVRIGNARYRGKPTNVAFRMALAQWGSIQIELIEQPGDEPSVYREAVPLGESGFHHMGAFVRDVDAELHRFRSLGAAIAFEGAFGDVHMGYVDTRAQLGFMIELFDHRPSIDYMFARVSQAAYAWDGSDPIRPFSSL
jgi:hypothetical protein